MLAFGSCSKNNSTPEPQKDDNTITINGTAYPTITIGNQVWTSVNYAGPGGKDADPSVDAKTYGKYYAASDLSTITLPAGWRIPTREDFNTLLKSFPEAILVSGNYIAFKTASEALRSTTGWPKGNGNNLSGFNAAAAGDFSTVGMKTYNIGDQAAFMSSTPDAAAGSTLGNYVLNLFAPLSPEGTTRDYQCLVAPYPVSIMTSLRFVKDK